MLGFNKIFYRTPIIKDTNILILMLFGFNLKDKL